MPQIIRDPSLNSGIVNNGGTDLFAYPDTPAASILDFQATPTQPLPGNTATATGMLSPDLQVSQRLANFPPEVYNLSPSSVLMHFLQAMLGDAGVGQLRKLQLVSQLQSVVTSTHFYDLDTFWGSLFGAIRGPNGTLPQNPSTGTTFNPYTDLASPDGWDQIDAIDALFRERIIALARAVTLGPTVPGLKAMAEALTGYPCNVYETWKLIDSQGVQGGGGQTWNQVMATDPTWSAFTIGEMWQQVMGVLSYGGMGLNARSEVVIQPRKNYPPTQAGSVQQAADIYGIVRVAEVLKPASALLSVDVTGVQAQIPVAIPAVWADSIYWELIQYVTPADEDDPAYAVAQAAYQLGGELVGATFPQPRPPASRCQGSQYSYVTDVTTVGGETTVENFTEVVNLHSWEHQDFATGTVYYLPAEALMESDRADTARLASPVAVTSAPYTGPRSPVATAG